MLLFCTLFPPPNTPCSITLIVLFSRMRYPRVPGAREGRRVHKKPKIKGCSLCSVSPVLCWNGRNVAGRPTGSQSLQPLMNFKRPFSFKAGCWLTACRLAKHSGGKRSREEERSIKPYSEQIRHCGEIASSPIPFNVGSPFRLRPCSPQGM